MKRAVLLSTFLLTGCGLMPASTPQHDLAKRPAVAPLKEITKTIVRTVVKQNCFKPKDYTTEELARFADEDQALKASGRFPYTIERIADYGREQSALKACVETEK